MQSLENQLPDAFIDTKKMTKSHIPIANAPAWIGIPKGQLENESKIRLKRGRPIGSKDITHQKRITQRRIHTFIEVYGEQEDLVEAYIEQETPEEVRDKEIAHEETQVPENYEILMSYVHKGYK